MAPTIPGNNIATLREYLRLEENISPQDFNNILYDATEALRRCLDPGQIGSTQGLIYGHVQSGKTAVIITTIALAADNGYRNFIVLTSDLNDLYEQTLQRIRRSLDSFQVLGKSDFQTYGGSATGAPLVLVSSKNTTILRRLTNLVQNLNWQVQSVSQIESVMIIDDEADQASLNTYINQNRPPSGVNQRIDDLRHFLWSCAYLQTTATPQALVLQDAQSAFRPGFVVVTTPGAGYTGGNYFFNEDDLNRHIRLVPFIHVTSLRTNNQIPHTVVQSLCLFFMGAAILRFQGNNRNYTYLLHTSFRQADHLLAADLVRQFVNELIAQLRGNINRLQEHFRVPFEEAYSDLEQTFDAIPNFQDALGELARAITSTEVAVINSSNTGGVNPDPPSRHTIYIGGTKLGRGVTIRNLLVTYYGRDANNPQIDTVLQHARMYGYRQSELPAIRIYLPRRLADRFIDIHTIDDAMREMCSLTYETIPLIPLTDSRLRPTRRNVLNQNTVDLNTYVGGRQYFPLLPVSEPNVLGNQTDILDAYLSEYQQPQQSYEITIDEILRILDPDNFQFSVPGSSGAWNDRLVWQAMSTLRDNPAFGNRGFLVVVNRRANLKRSSTRNYEQLGSVLPGNLPNPPYSVSANHPALFMTRLIGEVDPNGGWHGVPFWVPVVRFPNGNYAFAANRS